MSGDGAARHPHPEAFHFLTVNIFELRPKSSRLVHEGHISSWIVFDDRGYGH
jgi:hypothetical protein